MGVAATDRVIQALRLEDVKVQEPRPDITVAVRAGFRSMESGRLMWMLLAVVGELERRGLAKEEEAHAGAQTRPATAAP